MLALCSASTSFAGSAAPLAMGRSAAINMVAEAPTPRGSNVFCYGERLRARGSSGRTRRGQERAGARRRGAVRGGEAVEAHLVHGAAAVLAELAGKAWRAESCWFFPSATAVCVGDSY